MKKWIHRTELPLVVQSSTIPEDDDFDRRWNEKFGEPTTDVFVGDAFDRWMQEVIDFE